MKTGQHLKGYVLTVVPALLFYLLLARSEINKLELQYEAHFQARIVLILNAMSAIEAALDNTVAFFLSSRNVESGEFRLFTDRYLKTIPGVHSISWSPAQEGVPKKNLTIALSHSIQPEWNLRGKTTLFQVPANLTPDLEKSPSAYLMYHQDKDRNAPSNTDACLTFYQNVYSDPFRKSGFRGIISVHTHPEMMLCESIRPLKPSGLDIQFLLIAPDRQIPLTYQEPRLKSGGITLPFLKPHQTSFTAAGQNWLVTSTPGSAFLLRHWSWLPEIILVLSLLISFLLLKIFQKRKEENARVQKLVEIHTSALQESETRFQTIFESINDAIFIQDLDTGEILDVNRTMCQMYGYTREQVLSLDIPALSQNEPPYTIREATAYWEAASKGDPQYFRWMARHADGHLFWVEVNMRKALLDQRDILLVSVRDVTDRVNAEQQIQAIISNAPFGSHSYILEPVKGLIFMGANSYADQILGLNHQVLVGKTIIEAFPGLEGTAIPEKYSSIAVNGGYFDTDQVVYDHDQIKGAYEIHAFQTGMNRVTVFFRDITERKVAEQERERSLEEARLRTAVSQAFYHKETEEQVLDGIMESFRNTGNYSVAIVMFTDNSRREFRLVRFRPFAHQTGNFPYPLGTVFKTREFPVYIDMKEGSIVITNDVPADASMDELTKKAARQAGFNGQMLIPLTAGRDWLGVITLYSLEKNGFDWKIQTLGQILANQGGTELHLSRLREAMNLSRQRMSKIVELSPLGMIEWDMDFRVTAWNPAAERIFGFTRAEAIGRSAHDLIIPGNIHMEIQQVLDAIHNNTGGSHNVNENITKDGRIITCEWFNTRLAEADGRVIGVASLVLDISEQRATEEALKKEQIFTNAVLDSVPGLLYLYDVDGHLLRWNKAHETITGYNAEELSHMTLMDWYKDSPEDIASITAGVAKAFAEGYAEVDGNLQTKSGKRILFHFNAVLIQIDGKPYIVGIGIDITEYRRITNEIRELNASLEHRVAVRTLQLEAANKELEAFAYSVSHDLRAPLRSIDGFTRILTEDYSDRLDDEGKRICGVITGNTLRMGQLIDDLLSFSRLGRSEMQTEPVDMAALAAKVYEEAAALYPNPARAWHLNRMPAATGDRTMIRQVLFNLISNAVKYSSKMEKPLIEAGSMEKNGETIYYIRDNGAGFDMHYANKLFGVFQRLHSDRDFEGTGVGLAIVSRIITRHGGRIWAEAAVNEGATFYFTLPGKTD